MHHFLNLSRWDLNYNYHRSLPTSVLQNFVYSYASFCIGQSGQQLQKYYHDMVALTYIAQLLNFHRLVSNILKLPLSRNLIYYDVWRENGSWLHQRLIGLSNLTFITRQDLSFVLHIYIPKFNWIFRCHLFKNLKLLE